MTISNYKQPFVYIEFDPSNLPGSDTSNKAIMFGQKTSAGTATADVKTLVTSSGQAKLLFGENSMLHLMCINWFASTPKLPLYVIPQSDDSEGTKAVWRLAFAGTTASESKTVTVRINNKKVNVACVEGDTPSQFAEKVDVALTDTTNLAVVANATGANCDLTDIHKGEYGNSHYVSIDGLPEGLTCTVSLQTTGAGNPDITDSITALMADRYYSFIIPYNDTTNLALLGVELARRWLPNVMLYGRVFTALKDTATNAVTFADDFNDPHLSVLAYQGVYASLGDIVTAYARVCTESLVTNPAQPLHTLGLGLSTDGTEYTFTEVEAMLTAGLSVMTCKPSDIAAILSTRTTCTLDAYGDESDKLAMLETIACTELFQRELRTELNSRYGRHILVDDGTVTDTAVPAVTPSMIHGTVVSVYADLARRAVVEDVETFNDKLSVTRDVNVMYRINMTTPSDYANPLTLIAVINQPKG